MKNIYYSEESNLSEQRLINLMSSHDGIFFTRGLAEAILDGAIDVKQRLRIFTDQEKYMAREIVNSRNIAYEKGKKDKANEEHNRT